MGAREVRRRVGQARHHLAYAAAGIYRSQLRVELVTVHTRCQANDVKFECRDRFSNPQLSQDLLFCQTSCYLRFGRICSPNRSNCLGSGSATPMISVSSPREKNAPIRSTIALGEPTKDVLATS